MALNSSTVSADQVATATQYNNLRLDMIARFLIGEIKIWTLSTAPNENWLVCDGSAISRATYSDLFSIIGTTYGVGDGSTTFNIPNIKGKVPVGYNSAETEFDAMGEAGGAKTHTLTTAEIPAHTHPLQLGTNTTGSFNQFSITNAFNSDTSQSTLANTGGDGAHNNLQPYITLNYIICATNT